MSQLPERQDHRSPKEIQKGQRMMVFIFGFATLIPALWMVLIGWSGLTSSAAAPTSGSAEFTNFVIYWGLAAPVVWLAANALALKRIHAGNGDSVRHFPLIPAFWAIIWFASQVAG